MRWGGGEERVYGGKKGRALQEEEEEAKELRKGEARMKGEN